MLPENQVSTVKTAAKVTQVKWATPVNKVHPVTMVHQAKTVTPVTMAPRVPAVFADVAVKTDVSVLAVSPVHLASKVLKVSKATAVQPVHKETQDPQEQCQSWLQANEVPTVYQVWPARKVHAVAPVHKDKPVEPAVLEPQVCVVAMALQASEGHAARKVQWVNPVNKASPAPTLATAMKVLLANEVCHKPSALFSPNTVKPLANRTARREHYHSGEVIRCCTR